MSFWPKDLVMKILHRRGLAVFGFFISQGIILEWKSHEPMQSSIASVHLALQRWLVKLRSYNSLAPDFSSN